MRRLRRPVTTAPLLRRSPGAPEIALVRCDIGATSCVPLAPARQPLLSVNTARPRWVQILGLVNTRVEAISANYCDVMSMNISRYLDQRIDHTPLGSIDPRWCIDRWADPNKGWSHGPSPQRRRPIDANMKGGQMGRAPGVRVVAHPLVVPLHIGSAHRLRPDAEAGRQRIGLASNSGEPDAAVEDHLGHIHAHFPARSRVSVRRSSEHLTGHDELLRARGPIPSRRTRAASCRS